MNDKRLLYTYKKIGLKNIYLLVSVSFISVFGNLNAQVLTALNQKDSLGLKIGEWTETDTLATELIESGTTFSMTTKGCVTERGRDIRSIQKNVCLSKGNYSNGYKTGVWKYFRRGKDFYKQITYSYGRIQKVEIVHSNGQWRIIAIVNIKSATAHFITYDQKGNLETEGDIPEFLLYSSSMDLH